MRRAALLAVLLGPLVASCNDGPVTCPSVDFADGGLPDGAAGFTLVVGTEDASHSKVATPWTDGLHVPFLSTHGDWHVEPSVDVTTPAPLPENGGHVACLRVRMTASSPGGYPLTPVDTDVLVRRTGGTTSTYHVPPLEGTLGYDRGSVDGYPTRITISVLADSGGGSATLTVVPDSMATP